MTEAPVREKNHTHGERHRHTDASERRHKDTLFHHVVVLLQVLTLLLQVGELGYETTDNR